MKLEASNLRSEASASFPKALLSVSRAEFFEGDGADGPPLELEVIAGSLPIDLTGHVFVIGPVGSVDSEVIDTKNKVVSPASDLWTGLLNGDGMIYRFDFNLEPGQALLNSRLVKAPCYYMDKETKQQSESVQAKASFTSYGLTRISAKLGIRNQLNTAFLPLISNDPSQPDRLLVTWDAGRPYEIDPKSLETVTPVGKLSDWELVNPLFQFDGLPFSQIQTSAHPCFDRDQQQFITVNICKSLFSFLPSSFSLRKLWERIDYFTNKYSYKKFWSAVFHFFEKLPARFPAFLAQGVFKHPTEFLCSLFQASSLYLVTWDGVNDLKKYKIRLNDGSLVGIKETVHQMGLTKDYVVLMETAFKLNLNAMVGSPKSAFSKQVLKKLLQAPTADEREEEQIYQEVEGLLRDLFDYPQLPDSNLYIIRRADLQPEQDTVIAQKVVLKGEIAHFLVDYANPNDQISLHISFSCAWDVAEWIHKVDKTVCEDPIAEPQGLDYLAGLICGPLDISRLGRMVIKGDTGEIVPECSNWLTDEQFTWGPALYAYRDYPTPEQPNPEEQIQDIYWVCTGCSKELITDHIFHLYKDYPYRSMPIEDILKITEAGVPGNLLHLHIQSPDSSNPNEQDLTIVDVYQPAAGYYILSPQFVPRSGGTGGSTDGYIVCSVHFGTGDKPDNGNQIWIFDAVNLRQGPICKLMHPQLKLGFTVHTTWLPRVSTRTAHYHIPLDEDYQSIIQEQPEDVRQLFQALFPQYTWK